MLSQIRVIFSKSIFWKTFLIPVVLTLLFNIGLIFSLPNKISFLDSVVIALSKSVENNFSLAIMIGLFTVFVVFFTFAQFSYSNKSIPSHLIRKYVIEAKETIVFLGLQFSMISTLMVITILHISAIHIVNVFLSLMFLIFSAVLSVLYFFWLSKHIQAENLFRLIREQLNIDEIIEIEKKNLAILHSFKQSFETIKKTISYKLRMPKYIDDIIDNGFKVTTYNSGIVSNIDLDKLNALLDEIKDHLDEVILQVRIGETVPKFEPLPNITPETTLLKIVPKLPEKDEVNDVIQKSLNKNRSKIVDVFDIKQEKAYDKNKIHFRHIVEFFLFLIESNHNDGKRALDELSSFLITEIKKTEKGEWVNEIGLAQELYLELINIFESKLRSWTLSNSIIESTFSVIYSIEPLARKNRSAKLFERLMNFESTFYYLILSEGAKFSFYLSTLILYIKETSLQPLTNIEISLEEFETDKEGENYYRTVILSGINLAFKTYYQIIKNYSKFEEEKIQSILLENGKQLIDFLSPLNHWSVINPAEVPDDEEYEKIESIINLFTKYHAANLIFTSILIFDKFKKSFIPGNIVLKIAFPLVDNCNTIKRFDKSSNEYINEFIFARKYNLPGSSIFPEIFEETGIHEYGTYSPIYRDFSDFWIAYNIYLKLSNRRFVPSEIPEDRKSAKQHLISIQKRFNNIEFQKLSSLLGRDVEIEVNAYKEYIEGLIKQLN